MTASNVSATGTELYDSTALTGVDTAYRLYVRPTGDITARYWQAIVSDPSLSYLEAGRLVLGELWVPVIGHAFGMVDLIRRKANNVVSTGGQSWNNILHDRRVMSPVFPAITRSDQQNRFAEIRQFGAKGRDVLFLPDTGSDNLSRDSLWAELESDIGFGRARFNINQMQMTLAERL